MIFLAFKKTRNESAGRNEPPEFTCGFTNLDFQKLWTGREKVTAVERAILSALLRKTGNRRGLEVGTGNGRLSDIICSTSIEYVGTDINPAFLRNLSKLSDFRKARLLSSNLYSLPFRDNSFDTVIIIRVFNFLSNPVKALREMARVLIPGGSLIFSYSPRPSIATLTDDVKFAIRFQEKKVALKNSWKPITFSRRDIARLEPAEIPTFSFSGNYVNALLAETNLSEVTCLSSGLEDYRLTEHLPLEFFLNLAFSFRRVPWMPTRFILVSKAQGKGNLIRNFDDIFCCPRCKNPLELGDDTVSIQCNTCRFHTEGREGFSDLRYFPDTDVIT